ncbi:MAG TPA: hypothetical protein VN870_09225 [Streptosporangiaceae bacterium]|nr:hypothetical protein [Streptosporangiaceae bacterium]
MSRTRQLTAFDNVTLDENGNGTVQLGPTLPGVSWALVQAACATTSTMNEPVFNLYVGDAQPSNFLGGTFSGNNDCTDLAQTLYSGQYLTGQWVDGDPGATATMTLFGTKQVP